MVQVVQLNCAESSCSTIAETATVLESDLHSSEHILPCHPQSMSQCPASYHGQCGHGRCACAYACSCACACNSGESTAANSTEMVHGVVFAVDPKNQCPDTRYTLTRIGLKDECTVGGAMLPPIVQSTAFKQVSVERYQESGYSYSRCGNPTVAALEAKVGALEGSDFSACCFGTGMAATNCLFCAFLRTGDHVLITHCSYGGTNRAARVLYGQRFGIDVEFVDMADLAELERKIRPGQTRMILSETPCNPTLLLADLQAISDLCKAKNEAQLKRSESEGKQRVYEFEEKLENGDGPSHRALRETGRILHIADCTLMPPSMGRGLTFGCDVVLVSLTKYYCGHNAYLGGALVSQDPYLLEHMRFIQNVMGSIIAPATAFAIITESKTMELRVQRQSRNAMMIAEFLSTHPMVERVTYPGLKSHPQHEVALRQHKHGLHGTLVSCEVKGGAAAGVRVMNACAFPWTLAENLGATESIMTCPAVFTHSNMPREARLKVGITDGLIRLSVGVENITHLIASLDKALQAAASN